MKSNTLFRDQVNYLNSWFEKWSECEKTVVVYGLLKHLNATQIKFLAQALQQKDCSEAEVLEAEANNPAYIHQLRAEPQEIAVQKLLAHFPLLKVGNVKAKTEYLALIPQILTYSNENGAYVEESRQLLSYSVIHPALTSEEHAHFKWWISHLNERFTSNYPSHSQHHSPVTNHKGDHSEFTQCVPRPVGNSRLNGSYYYRDPTPEESSTSQNNLMLSAENLPNLYNVSNRDSMNSLHNHQGHHPLTATLSAPATVNVIVSSSQHTTLSNQENMNPVNKHQLLCRKPSLHPHHGPITPMSHVSDWLKNSESEVPYHRGRSHSLTFEQGQGGHPPLSPQSSITSSGSSDTHQDMEPMRNSFLEEGSGMRDVPTWLKSLRLHKYAYLFQQMTYEEMLTVSEDWLETQNVTKGARHKIVLSLSKLKERQDLLRSMEKDIVDGGSISTIKSVLSEMKSMLNTPIKAFSTEDSSQIPSSPPPSPVSEDGYSIPEGDVSGQFTRVMWKACTQLLVTTPFDDECFNLFIQVIDKCLNHEAFSPRQKKRLASWKHEAQRNWQPKYIDRRKQGFGGKQMWGNSLGMQRSLRFQKPGPQWSFGTKRSILGGTTSGHAPLTRNSSLNPSMFSRQGPLETQKPPVTRTQSAPLRSPHQLGFNVTGCEQIAGENLENYAQLDSLCLSVTEHALGSSLETNEKGTTY
ncbi:protein Smaug homolog 1-like [Crassostrea virginica]|uniref:Protein Smaug homolog 1-like n=1 Tax=Crassostrea virginica TaxID=6565 RepID=A0A8B8DTY5_CRAVI|nr:protein Smaug homolog 1-like [Crassostrea virginica]XP_022331355.1 protein Smaug homolog 1-like [Crassostrea virginica]